MTTHAASTASAPKFRAVTYLGQQARVAEIHLSGSKTTGRRVVITHWIDAAIGQPVAYAAGTVEATVMTGDGRYSGGPKAAVVFERATFATEADAIAWARTR